MISVVMPTLNAAAHLPRSLPPLVSAVVEGVVGELVISDGGSRDATCAIADEVGAVIVQGERGRGTQLRAGAEAARGEWLLFLHADTALEEGWEKEAKDFMRRMADRECAAAFRFAFDDASVPAQWIGWWVGVRCALFKLPYGDQGLLLSRSFYEALGGYRAIPLMEDLDIVRRIGAWRLQMLRSRAITSAERYLRDGYTRRVRRNLWLLTRYFLGADPTELARHYD